MKASELCDQLKELIQEHGDQGVVTWNCDYGDGLGLVNVVEFRPEITLGLRGVVTVPGILIF